MSGDTRAAFFIAAATRADVSTPVSPTLSSTTIQRLSLLGFTALGLGGAWWGLSQTRKAVEEGVDDTVLTNWSATHEVKPK